MLRKREKKTGKFIIALVFFLVTTLGHLIVFHPNSHAAPPQADAGANKEIVKNTLFGSSLSLDGSGSSDADGDFFILEWYGPFGSALGVAPIVSLPQGTSLVSLQAVGCPESSEVKTTEVTVAPAFTIEARSKIDVVQLTWAHLANTIRYDVYRATSSDPFTFTKIAETTSTYSTYLDENVTNETNYLYAVAAIATDNSTKYSNIVASCPPQNRTTARLNRPPFIYSPAIAVGTPGMVYNYTVLAADANADTLIYSLVSAPSGMVIDGNTGKISWTPPEIGSYEVVVKVSDGKGLDNQQTYSINVTAPQPTVGLIARPEAITLGLVGQDRSTLSWCATHADYCILDNSIGEVDQFGNKEVQPKQTTEYSITAHGPGGTASDKATITVNTLPVLPPTVDIFADPQAIAQGDTSQLYWHSTNADTVTIDQNIGTVAPNSEDDPNLGRLVSPEKTTTYTITATGPGGTATDTVTVTVTALPPTVNITADPRAIALGGKTQLFWNSTNAHSVEIDQDIGKVALNSSESDHDVITHPQTTTTYTITATGPGGTATDSVTVSVSENPPPTVSIVAIPDRIGRGQSSWLYWHSANADSITIDQSIGTVGANGCHGGDDEGYYGVMTGECGEGKNVNPQVTTTYTITAVGPGGTATDSVTVTVTEKPLPTVEIIARPESIQKGDDSWLYWHSTNADSITIDQKIGTVAANGCHGGDDEGFWEGVGEVCGEGKMVSPQTTTTYTITASGPGGTVTDSVTVSVTPPPPPTVEIIAVPNSIQSGDNSWLYWHSTNAEIVSIDQGVGVVAANGCQGGDDEGYWDETIEECGVGRMVSPQTTTTYTITAIGAGGISKASVTVTVNTPPPPTVEITADPEHIAAGDSSWLAWRSTNATTVTIDQGIGVVAINSCGHVLPSQNKLGNFFINNAVAATAEEDGCEPDIQVSPVITTTYRITATGPGGTATDSVTVVVGTVSPPTVDIIAAPEIITSGQTTWLEWHSSNATEVSIDQGIGVVSPNSCNWDSTSWNSNQGDGECQPRISQSPTVTTTYTITARGPGGTVSDSVTVYVNEIPPPVVDITAQPETISVGGTSWLYWHSKFAETVTIDQGIGVVSPNGCPEDNGECDEGRLVSPITTTTYTITATGPGGTATDNVTVVVDPNLPPTVDITAAPEIITSGQSTWLEWHSTNATTVTIDQDIVVSANSCKWDSTSWNSAQDQGECSPRISKSPTVTTTYRITATGPGGTATDSVTVYVDEIPPPAVDISAQPNTIGAGGTSLLRWHSKFADTVTIDQGIGVVPNNECPANEEDCGEGWSVSPATTTTYTITATGPGGTTTDSVTISVESQTAPKADFYAQPTSIFRGSSTALHWHTTQAHTVSIDQGIGGVSLNSDQDGLVVTPEETTTYTLTAIGPAGKGSISLTVIVLDPLPPLADLLAWPETIEYGKQSTLAWSSVSADKVIIKASVGPDLGEVAVNSDISGIQVSPVTTTTYTLTATGTGGEMTDAVTVKVLPKIEITANPAKIQAGDSCVLTIHTINGETVSIDQGIGSVQMTAGETYHRSGTVTISPLKKTTYTVTATGNGGTSTESVTIDVGPKVNFSVDQNIIEAGTPAHLHWTTVQAEKVTISPIGVVALNSESGGRVIAPHVTTTYLLEAEGLTDSEGRTSSTVASVKVHVNDFSKPPVINSFIALPEMIDPGNTAVLQWETANMQHASIDNGIGEVPLFGAVEVSPKKSTIYTLTVSGPKGNISQSIIVRVKGTLDPDTFIASPSIIEPGASTLLKWETVNIQHVRIDNGIGEVPIFGELEVTPQRTTTYTLTATGSNKGFARKTTVRVKGTYLQGSFGAMYEDDVPITNTVNLTEDNFSLLTGTCIDRDGNPVAGVEVSVLGKPEFGKVLTNSQGRYSLPVLGNAYFTPYTVVINKQGFLPVHRNTEVMNNQVAVVDTVALTEPAAKSTLIDFSSSSEPEVFHGGVFVNDTFGNRRLSLTLPSGSLSSPMNMVTTEYPTAAALPAPLPPNAAFSYVAEIGNTQQTPVSFTEPVIAWVENFLGFEVGQKVPVGWYDRSKGLWIPQKNGIVIELLDGNSDGVVDGLDSTGDHQADDLDSDGEYADEVAGLPSEEMVVGATYYRFPVDRSGAWACSWPFAPLAATIPAPPTPSYDLESCPSKDCKLKQEDITLPGTKITLHYSEARVSAYQPQITIPVTGATVPANVKEVIARMTVAGRVYEQHLESAPNQTIQIQWDGKDFTGQEVVGPTTAEIAIGYIYNRNYALAGTFSQAFSQAGVTDAAIASRQHYTAWHKDRLYLNRLTRSRDFIADGWTLSLQHQANTTGPATLNLGYGGSRSWDDKWDIRAILDSQGSQWGVKNRSTNSFYNGVFGLIDGIAVNDATQSVYWSSAGFDTLFSHGANYFEKLSSRSSVPYEFAGDYDNSLLKNPSGIAIDAIGNIFYADSGNHVIRRISRHYDWNDPHGYAIYAGKQGQPGYAGDGGALSGVSLNSPGQMATDRWGNFYIVDKNNHVIRRISPDGIIETIAGNGASGSNGDNGPALAAAIDPEGIDIDLWGNIYLAEPAFNKVRKIDISGNISTFADQLTRPASVAVNSLGTCFIATRNRLLEVDANGNRIAFGQSFGDLGVMTSDLQDRLFFNDRYALNVYRMGITTFADMADGNYFRLPDATGQAHYFSKFGQILFTGSPTTPTYSFIYDLFDRLIAIKDATGNVLVTLNRDEDGKVLSLETAEGTTSLTIDNDNDLVKVLTPAHDSVTLEYDGQDLLTNMEAAFTGALNGVVKDSASGSVPLSGVTVTLTTTKTTTSVETNADGAYSFTDIEPGAYTLTFQKSGYFRQSKTGSLTFGNSRVTHTISLLAYPHLTVSIGSPQNNAVFTSSIVKVTGQVSNNASVTVNGVAATVTGTQFSADITLNGNGEKTITATAVDSYGQHASAEVHVQYNYPELHLKIESPKEGAVIFNSALKVTGEVSNNASVTVNGVAATLTGDHFSADVMLSGDGEKTITVTAVDSYGQHASDAVQINYYNLPTVTLSTSSNLLQPGEAATLSWTSENSNHCLLEPLMTEMDCNGSLQVRPTKTSVYTINATGLGKTARASITIVVGNSYGNPSIAEQAHLEAINLARANPTTEAARLSIDLNEGPPSQAISPNPVQPLAFNRFLHLAATLHTEDMVTKKYQAHQAPDGRNPEDRIRDAGYLGTTTGENLASKASSSAMPEIPTALELHDNLFIDEGVTGRGHRINILQSAFKEIGIGFQLNSNQAGYAFGGVATCNFGAFANGPGFLLGVVYDDTNHSASYSAGEGLSGVEIRIDSSQATVTATSGGYALPLQPGNYTVTATLPDGRKAAKQFSIDTLNKKIDFIVSEFTPDAKPIVSLSAAALTIRRGDTTKLIWTSANAHMVSLDQGIGIVPYNGAVEVSPQEDTDYTITATNAKGSARQTIHIKVLDPLPALSLTATPDAVWPGDSATLSWTCEHTQSCSIDQGIGKVSLNGTLVVRPDATTTYTLTAQNAEGTSTSKATVTVRHAAITLDHPFEAIDQGGTATLKWTTADTDDCSIDQGVGTVPLNGTMSLSPTATTVYTVTCHGHGTTATAPFTIHINDSAAIPIAQITADTTAIRQGQSVTLNWYSGNGSEFHIDNGIGKVAFRGSLTTTPSHTTTYTFTAIGPAGVARSEVIVRVIGSPASQPLGSFGKDYENLIPADATVEKYEARQFALIKGSIQDIHAQPLAGISVTILDHPEYGSTTTNAQGEYVLPVEGGASMTVVYRKAGLLPSQRQVYVPWNDIALIKPVQMIAEDNRSTTVHFDGNANTVTTHRASAVTDQFGSRAMTMVFRGDNTAYLVDEKGATIKAMPTIVTRATEYSTPKSMPAELPKVTAYTYCTELTVDGAQRVRFAKPVVTFVENFLGFAVGQAVPLGYYDRDRGEWIAEPNGLVVKLLDSDSNGVVDSLDKDGDGAADDLNGDGDVHDEVRGLEDAAIYVPGATFWRAEISHFTPWDWNWCSLQSLLNMLGYGKPQIDGQNCTEGCAGTGSSVSNESRIFHEDIAIPGTGFSLTYTSDRTNGFKTRFTVPASGTEVPESVKRIIVEVDIAGRVLTQTLEAKPNQMAEFLWDGLDFRGQEVTHKVIAHVKVGYVYDSEYMESGYLKMSFAQFGTAITPVPTRDEVISWQQSDLTITMADKGHNLAQGWSISTHHRLSPTAPSTLYKGDGSITRNITSVMSTAAGNGEEGWPQTGSQALQTPFTSPVSVVNDSSGDLYVANQIHASIVKIKRDGTVEVLAGGQAGQKEEDGIDAREAQLQMPSDLALDSRGRLYIADAGSCKIRRIDEKGIITTIAGNGTCGSAGDDGPALLAEVTPNSLAVDDFGNVYFVESTSCVGGEVDPVTGECTGGTTVEGSYRVRKVSTNGQIATVVGTGEKYDPNVHTGIGDNGPASAAVLVNPTSLSIDPDGNIYLADGPRIRKINTSGLITTVAGSGATGYSGDGGLAKDARITLASGITFDRSGNFYFSQFYGNGDVVRKVTSNGYISTVAGKGSPGLDGDNGPATHALLYQPNRVAIDPAGFIYIPDRGNHLIRKVSIETYSEKEIRFAEENGLGHLISAAGLHLSTYDLKTGITLLSFGYDTENRLISITDQFDRVTKIERLGDGTASAIVSPDGLRTGLTIDSHNQLTKMSYPDSEFFSFEYENNDGLLTAKVEPNGNRFEHFFDDNGRITHTNNQEDGFWQFIKTESADGMSMSRITTPNTTSTVETLSLASGEETKTTTAASGEKSVSSISADGLDDTITSTCGPEVKTFSDLDRKFGYTYPKSTTLTTPAGLVLQSSLLKDYTDADLNGIPEQVSEKITVNNKTTTLVQDVDLARLTVTSPENRAATSTYDPNTLRPLTTEIPGLLATSYEYFSDGRLRSTTSGARSTGYTYDGQGNLATITDPGNRVTRFTHYDGVGRPLRVEQADGSIIGYDYDANGNMTRFTTPRPADNGFTYNKVSKPASFVSPLGSTTRYSYNQERQLTGITLPSGKTISNTYQHGLLTRTTTPEGIIDFSYGCGSLVSSMTRGSETVGYDYDGNLPVSLTQSGSLNQSLAYVYNNDFKLSSFSYAGATESYTYDNDGLLTTAGPFAIARKAENGLPERISTDNFVLARSFNGYGEIEAIDTTVSGSAIFGYNLTRDNNGRITSKTETVNGTESRFDYTYDDLGRLLTVKLDGNTIEEYHYDNNGNRISETNSRRGIENRTLTHSTEDHIITAGAIRYEFDLDDKLAARIDGSETTEYSYASTGELLGVKLPDARVISYINDPLGRRIAKKIDGVIVEKYLWSGLTTLLAVYDGSDTLLQRFVFADGRMPSAMTAGGSTYYLSYDQVGSLRLVTDSSGNIVKKIDYDSFGNILSDSNLAFTVPFGFAGGLHDRDTGLVRFGFRDYLPEIGKWTAKDPIGFTGGDSNLYGYAQNDPVNWIDPLGLETLVIINGPTSGNPFGHTAIATTGSGLYSPGNNPADPNLNYRGTSVTDYMAEQAKRRESMAYILPTTSEQEKAIIDYMKGKTTKPEKYPDNCAGRVGNALKAGNVNLDDPMTPGKNTAPFPASLMRALEAMKGNGNATSIKIPYNGSISPNFNSFNPH